MAKIMMVDDDPDVVEVCRLVLESQGYEFYCAFDREAGMAAISQHSPDMLILDVMMATPEDGIEMAYELRDKGFEQPILILTSVSGASKQFQERGVPVNDYAEKPLPPADLIKKVQALLASG